MTAAPSAFRRGRPDPRIGPSLFIAIPLPSAASDEVTALVRDVRREPDRSDDAGRDPRDVRWVRMGALHLTLRFLGPTPPERIPQISEILDRVAETTAPFVVRLSGTGAFPTPDRPRTLWLGVSVGLDELAAIASSLSNALTAAGWPLEDRPFRAHLTLARSDGVRAGPAVAHALDVAAAERGFAPEFTADRVVLFESRTGHGAAHYEPLHEVRLHA